MIKIVDKSAAAGAVPILGGYLGDETRISRVLLLLLNFAFMLLLRNYCD
jgi:hypothetical protein